MSPPEGLEQFSQLREPEVLSIKTKGKFMYWTFSDGWFMFLTFGMSGQLSPIRGKHPCFVFQFNDGSKIYFNDPRHFGTIRFTNSERELKDKLDGLGWDPLAHQTDDFLPWIKGELLKSKKPIGQVLLDQSIFGGVGNYLRCEGLYEAKISPWTICKTLSPAQMENLYKSIIKVVNDSYAHQGATLLTYKDAYGNEGKYSSCFKVYGKDEDPFGHPVITETTPEGRTIHWCPDVQK